MTDSYRPLSKRGVPDNDFDGLHDGVPPWMLEPVLRWFYPVLYETRNPHRPARLGFIERMEMAMRLPAFPRHSSSAPAEGVIHLIQLDEVFALDAIDYVLQTGSYSDHSAELSNILDQCGSVWAVTQISDDRWTLTQRELESAKFAVADLQSVDQKAGGYLNEAWQNVATRNPDPGKAYERAVFAIEAAAQPVICPKNDKATLGTIIRDLRAKPEKWAFELGDVELVIEMADRIWTRQFRHGTQERADHTLAEADAALHMAIPLVRYFVGGFIGVAAT